MTIAIAVFVAIVLLYFGRGYWAWCGALAVLFASWKVQGIDTPIVFTMLLLIAIAVALVFGLPILRRRLVSTHLMQGMKAVLPRIGDTERVALEAGTVWWDGDLFPASRIGESYSISKCRHCRTQSVHFSMVRSRNYVAWSMNGRSRRIATCRRRSGTFSRNIVSLP